MKLKRALVIDIPEHESVANFKVVTGLSGFDINNVAKDINHSDFPTTNTSDTKLYFTPGCVVPRVKVREAYKCTNKMSAADYTFINEGMIESSEGNGFIQHKYLQRIRPEYLTHKPGGKLNIGSIFTLEGLITEQNAHLKPLYQSLIHNVDYVYVTRNIYGNSWNSPLVPSRYNSERIHLGDMGVTSEYSHDWKKNEHRFIQIDPKGDFAKLVDEEKLYFDSTILPYVNKDNVTIDEDLYESYRAMALSDDETLDLTMEMLSNCNYAESVHYIVFLLKEFGYKMSQRKSADHVNFKSLLNFVSLTKQRLHNGLELIDATHILKEHKKFTKSNAFVLSKLYVNASDHERITAGWDQGPVYTGEM